MAADHFLAPLKLRPSETPILACVLVSLASSWYCKPQICTPTPLANGSMYTVTKKRMDCGDHTVTLVFWVFRRVLGQTEGYYVLDGLAVMESDIP
ncbi:hypothetical protein GALMADRAFT_903587 [Galerina marginata CBS 339.88]|uniref:Uncharacterized protein n=1 Tax=Galerina marginata (strain CBS 339.88) TaxID=685588 RepID=A0A067SGN4_GALM3|nr:hypothetical protein GALMADRAFT_903587 [Galerina marginata CBS 339.88]